MVPRTHEISMRTCSLKFTNECEKVFDSSAYDETRSSSILGCDCDEWPSHYFSEDQKDSPATDALEFGRRCTPSFNVYLLVVKVKKYVL